MTSDTYGRMSPALLPSFGPDGSFLRTSQATYRLASIPCCEIYGAWASRLRLAYSQRRKSVQAMNGSGCSLWPTARAYDQETGRLVQTRLPQMVKANQHLWTTPQAHDVTMRGSGQVPTAKAGNACLARDAAMWGTPRGSDGEKGGPNQKFGAGGTPLPAQAATWPTPAARDHKGENSADHLENGTGRLHLDQLPNAVAHLFSHPDHQTPRHGATLSDLLRIWRPLRASVIASHGRATWRRLMKARGKRRLNPGFVEWLMGWPPGHALCDCSATEFVHWQRHMRFALSRQPMACGPWIWKPPAEAEMMQLDMFGGEA